MPSYTASQTPNPITLRLLQGSTAFSAVWRYWRLQWTQPQLLKLSDAYLGFRGFHSSQMSGFANRTLRDPSPKAFMAIGYLNLAHARSLGYAPDLIEDVPDIGLPSKLPDTLRAIWEGREPLCDASGVVLGPTGLFQAFSGFRELSYVTDRHLAPEHAAKAIQALGRWLRLHLSTQGIDWLSELPALRAKSEVIEPLLMGHDVDPDRLLYRLPQIAELAHTTDAQLWSILQEVASTEVGS